MEDIFKYQRVQGKIEDIVKNDDITAACLEENSLIIGTQSGYIHIISLTGMIIKTMKSHDRAVNAIDVDNNGLTIFSCSDSGTAVVCSLGVEGEDKESIVYLNQPLKAICKEDSDNLKRGLNGQIIHHKHAWFSQKDVELFRGTGSAVTAIQWRGNVVAWADSSQVRLMDINTETAICFINCPNGVGPQNPFPCYLCWETDYDLLIGWADTVRHIQLVYTAMNSSTAASSTRRTSTTSRTQSTSTPSSSTNQNGGYTELRAKTVADWCTDSIVCGISSFDTDNIALLCYMPLEQMDVSVDDHIQVDYSTRSHTPNTAKDFDNVVPEKCPELQLVKRSTGQLISADLLPLFTNSEMINQGTSNPLTCFHLVCSYNCYTRRNDNFKWTYATQSSQRGGMRNLSPVYFVITYKDVILVKVRDINDRVRVALEHNDLRLALEIAHSDRLSLRMFNYHDLLKTYIDLLFRMDKAELAASECSKFIGDDAMIWENMIFAFAARKRLSCIAPFVPTSDPRLPESVYEVILAKFLFVNTRSFLTAVIKWGRITPRLFDIEALLDRVTEKILTSTASSSSGQPDMYCVEAQAHLYVLLRKYESALNSYMSIQFTPKSFEDETQKRSANINRENINANNSISGEEDESEKIVVGGTGSWEYEHKIRNDFQTVFDLIEKHNLYACVKDKIKQLIMMSKELSEDLLLKNVDKLPINSVVKQLRDDPALLHWYLHILFTKLNDIYNTPEYSDMHTIQLSLYAMYAPPSPPRIIRADLETASSSLTSKAPIMDLSVRSSTFGKNNSDTNLMKFLKTCDVPLELAILLREIGDIYLAVEYVQEYDVLLWEELIDYSMAHHTYLAQLLDVVGLYTDFSPQMLIWKLPPCMEIPYLRQRLIGLLQHCEFQEILKDKCRQVVQDDTVAHLRQLNQTQRKSIKINPKVSRCSGCGRPVSMVPSAFNAGVSNALDGGQGQDDLSPSAPAIWGSRINSYTSNSGVVALSNKQYYHYVCFEKAFNCSTNI